MLLAPRKRLGEHLGKRSLRVDRARVDIEQRALLRKPPPALRVSVFLAYQVEHVRGVSCVEHPEAGRQPERRRVPTDEMVGDGMEGAAQHAAGAVRHRHQRPRALQHLPRRATRERQQQDPLRRHPAGDEPRDPSAKRRRLTRPRPGQDQQGAARMTNRRTLFAIQLLKPRRLFNEQRRGLPRSRIGPHVEHVFPTLSQRADGLAGDPDGASPDAGSSNLCYLSNLRHLCDRLSE